MNISDPPPLLNYFWNRVSFHTFESKFVWLVDDGPFAHKEDVFPFVQLITAELKQMQAWLE